MANTAKLLLLQGGRCFYCGDPLSLDDATLEHIIPKAMGGEGAEFNTVACCAAVNHLLGNATPKEKLEAVLRAGGRLECPRKVHAAKGRLSGGPAGDELSISAMDKLQTELDKSFEVAAAQHQGTKANLSALGLELRKRIEGFTSKQYGHKLFGSLVKELGYRVDGQWAFRKK